MAAKGRNLRILRGLIRELRLGNEQIPVKSTPQMAYIMEQFRQNQVTTHKVCRGHNQMEHLADTYKCLLESVRKNQELIEQYKGRGERSVEESARLVGLSLPKNPETTT